MPKPGQSGLRLSENTWSAGYMDQINTSFRYVQVYKYTVEKNQTSDWKKRGKIQTQPMIGDTSSSLDSLFFASFIKFAPEF